MNVIVKVSIITEETWNSKQFELNMPSQSNLWEQISKAQRTATHPPLESSRYQHQDQLKLPVIRRDDWQFDSYQILFESFIAWSPGLWHVCLFLCDTTVDVIICNGAMIQPTEYTSVLERSREVCQSGRRLHSWICIVKTHSVLLHPAAKLGLRISVAVNCTAACLISLILS